MDPPVNKKQKTKQQFAIFPEPFRTADPLKEPKNECKHTAPVQQIQPPRANAPHNKQNHNAQNKTHQNKTQQHTPTHTKQNITKPNKTIQHKHNNKTKHNNNNLFKTSTQPQEGLEKQTKHLTRNNYYNHIRRHFGPSTNITCQLVCA